ncbi:MAG TPA: glycosyltransferase family 1 protein [Acidobacteriaceae bacterium]|jgi:glycosyltransferase involved in cell wall biosynthesis
MKVVIALTSSSGQLSGVQRHAVNLARCLLTREQITAVHLIAAPWQQEFVHDAAPRGDARLHLHTALVRNTSLSRNLWYYAQLPKIAAQLGADIVHLAYPAPLNERAYRCPTVVSLHDLYPYDVPQNFGFPKALFNQLVLQQCLRAANAIACVSRTTLARLESMEPRLALAKATAIYNCVEPQSCISDSGPLPDWSGESFLLCVAQHRRNKNILFLLRIFERLLRAGQFAAGTRLVILGIPGPETHAIRRFISKKGIVANVLLLNGLSEQELQWCYRNCEVLLAPSLVEGFGLPVAEALLAGCRVICSDIPAFRELGGNHCVYIPLNAAAEQVFSHAICAAIRKRAPKPVALPQLSAPFIAEQYLQLYQSLLLRAPALDGSALSASIPTSEGNHIL